MNLDLDELIKEEIIDETTASRIRNYYVRKKNPNASSRLIQVVSILGICLIGLGLILIIGYNWDQLPRLWRIVIAFIPLLTAQAIGAMTLLKDRSNLWHESSAIAILFSVGIAMTLITQIYFLDVNMTEFLKLWVLLSIPLIYIFDSAVVSIAVWIGIGWYITKISWNTDYDRLIMPFVMMVAAIIPYFLKTVRSAVDSRWAWHHWVVPIVLTMFIFSWSPFSCSIMMMIYLVITFIAMDTWRQFYISSGGILNNGYKVISFVGIWGIAFMMTFKFFWMEAASKGISECFHTHPSLLMPLIFGGIAVLIIWLRLKNKIDNKSSEVWWIGFILIALILIGDGYRTSGRIISNVLILLGAARMIYRGINQEELPVLNLGILLLTTWIICRFFDDLDISFLWRGIIFIALGVLCFSLNYALIKKRKS